MRFVQLNKLNRLLFQQTMSLSFVTNSAITGITSLNSKFFHVNMFGCSNIDIHSITITAPGDSPNTDGIHMGASSNIIITNSTIGTGDDCVSVGSGTTNVTVSGVTCGPGHGISVGSLGKDEDKGDVVGFNVRNSKLSGTANGIRIKTWQGKKDAKNVEPMMVSGFTFDDVVMENVMNPIIIDQEYCPYASCVESEPSRVQIKDIKFNNIRGTSSSAEVIKLRCSKTHPCEGLELKNIQLQYIGNDKALKETATCENVKVVSSNVKPVSC
ncbi:polygalacturonase-like [Asparagus officinalis]|uniref:polygalacturonase-like n=1 Tax=Asparagus officinalis TaxID=4686 RepID=UPI00098E3B43|nr:polygalacturonase-like [Asparagus officinalis]